MSTCTYRYKDASSKEVVITGQAEMKAFLADGGIEQLLPGKVLPWRGRQGDAEKYSGPRDVSSREGQMELANRAGTIAALKAMNAQLRAIAPDEAWADANIEQAADLDALRNQISEALVKASRGEQQDSPLRKRLEAASGQDLKAVFDAIGLAGSRMTHDERVKALMAENPQEVLDALDSVEAGPATTAEPEPAKAGASLEGPRREPTKVSMFNPYQDGDVVTIGGQDWQVKQDMPGWYLTSTGNWRGTHPKIQRIRGMADLIREVEQAYQEAVPAPEQPAPQPAKAEEKSARQKAVIEDFGAKLDGARKDMQASMSKEWADDEIASQPFSKVWPATDIDAIQDPFEAAVMFAAREEVPAKPRVSYKLKAWVAKVKMFRELVSRVIGDVGRDRYLEKMKEYGGLLDGFRSKVVLLEALDRSQWKRIGQVAEYPNAYVLNDGKKVPAPQSVVEIDGKRERFDGSGSVLDALDKINEKLGVAAEPKKMQFEVRGREGFYGINKKGDKEYRKLKTFATSKEAFAYIKENYDDLVAAWDGVKDRDNVGKADVRNDTNRPRTGSDWRQGKDVTPEQFSDAFGFRGVQFGIWVSQGAGGKDRQGMLNQAYDALMDLADIVGVPPKALSLNGSLGLAFGARGSGNASAHYEPSNLVINLTKTKGAGTLAHEWFHALDNYFSRQRGGEVKIGSGVGAQEAYRTQNYITYRPEPMYVHKTQRSTPITKAQLERYHERSPQSGYYDPQNWQIDPTHPQGVRPEVERAFADLVEALDNSPMKVRAAKNDKGADGYWSRIIERGARAFENYVIHKMRLKGYDNDYLANVRKVEDFPRDAGRYPYLLDEEVEPIAEAFDNLFAEVKTKETEQGVAMFRTDYPNTQAFREWFGSSKMTNNAGEPLLFMHGSPASFEAFDTDKLGTSSSHTSSGLGHFFTRDKATAEKYADGGNIYTGWLKIEKPYVMMIEEAQAFDDAQDSAKRRKELQKMGYDGVVILDDDGKPWATVAFEPWQFKSADNNGAFDEFDDRMRFRNEDQAMRDTSTMRYTGDVPRKDAEDFIRKFVAEYPGAPSIMLADSFDQLPESIRKDAIAQGSGPTRAKGALKSDTAYVVLNNHHSMADLEATIFHEVLGHSGVRKMFGPEFSQELNRLFVGLGGYSGLQKIMEQRGLALQFHGYFDAIHQAKERNPRAWTDALAQSILTEEVFAHIAEQKNGKKLRDRFMALVGMVRDWLRRHGFASLADLGESDIVFLLQKAREGLREGDGVLREGTHVGEREIVDADGRPVARESSPDYEAIKTISGRLGLREREAPTVFANKADAGYRSNMDDENNVAGKQAPTQAGDVKGSAQWALNAYQSGVIPDGWYVHGRQGRGDLGTNGVLQLTRDWDVADQYSGAAGSSKWLIRPKDGADTLDLSAPNTADMDRVVESALSDFERGRLPWLDDLEASLGRDADAEDVETAVRDEFAPSDIVDSAKAYDSQSMSEWLADAFDYPSFVITPDGAVVFSRDGIEAVKVPNESSASVGSDAPAVLRTEFSAPEFRQKAREELSTAAQPRGQVAKEVMGNILSAFKEPSSKVFGPLHKSIATQLHKAWVSKDYARVFNLADSYERDISRFSANPASAAPNLLPAFDNLRDAAARMLHGDRNAKLMDKVADALFAGTLAGEDVTEGRVWNDADLRDQFGLDDAQIKLYREAREAIDASLDATAAGLAWQTVKKYIPDFKDSVKAEAGNAETIIDSAMREAEAELREVARYQAEVEADGAIPEGTSAKTLKKAQDVAEARAAAEAIFARSDDLKRAGYAPLMRFGKYAVDVVETLDDGTEERLGFYKFETEIEAKLAAQKLQKKHPDAKVTRSVMSEEAWKIYKGVDPDLVALFADKVDGLEGLSVDNEVMQEWYRSAVNQRSAFKRMIHRKGVEGFDRDLTRVVASFITSNARVAARQFNMGDLSQAIADMQERKVSGDVVDEAVRLKDYMENPTEPFQGLKGWMFAWFLGGSVASAALNLTQPLMMTLPYLSQFGTSKAAAQLAKAAKEAATNKVSDEELKRALAKAAKDGKVDPQQVHHLYHEGLRPFISKLPLGDGMRERAQGLMTMWGFLFGATENFNRRITFIAAYRMAKEDPSLGNPYDFAIKAIDETQGIYCVDPETEILTAAGWKKYSDLVPGEAIFSVDMKGSLVHDVLRDVHVFHGRHEVTEFRNSRGLSIVVTDDHRNIIQNYNSRDKKWQQVRAVKTKELKNCHFFLRAPLGDATNREAIYSDDQVRLLAWVAAEGHFFAHRNVKEKRGVGLVQSESHNPEYVKEIDDLLGRLGGHFNRKIGKDRRKMVCWQLRKPLWSFIHEALPMKRVDMALLSRLTVPQMAIFLETFAKADGTIPEAGGVAIGQKSVETLNTLQAMAVLTGKSSTMWERQRNLVDGGFRDYGTVYVAKNSIRAYVKEFDRERRVIDTVWCPQTDTGTWIARRNGRTFITGNSKANRPNWARGTGPFGAIGVAAFTFKQYSIGYIELLVRMAKSGKNGRLGAAMMLGLLVMMSGLQGAPGADDLEDIIDTVSQYLGYTGNSRLALKQWLRSTLGDEAAKIVMYGGLSALPFDMASRVGMGNLAPASAIFKPSEQNRASQLAELFGPPLSMSNQVLDAALAMESGAGIGGVANAFAPVALRNVMKAYDMASTGEYRDSKGRKVTDVSLSDAAFKAVGLQPSSVSDEQKGIRLVQMTGDRIRQVKAAINGLKARAIVENDNEMRSKADSLLAEWNRDNPDARISPDAASVMRRVKEMRAERRARMMKSLPREYRAVAEGEMT